MSQHDKIERIESIAQDLLKADTGGVSIGCVEIVSTILHGGALRGLAYQMFELRETVSTLTSIRRDIGPGHYLEPFLHIQRLHVL